MGSATPSHSGVGEHKGIAAGGRPGLAPSRGGGVRASEGTNPCTRPSFAIKNVFDVLQDLSESIGGSPGPQLDAADWQPELIVHDLHHSLVELLEWPEILSLHAVRRVGREQQLHLKVRALCGEVRKGFRRVGRHGSTGQLGQGWPTSTRLFDRQSETCQAKGGERPVHGGRHEGSGHWAAVREPP